MEKKGKNEGFFFPSAPIAIAPHFQHSCAKSRSYYSSKDAISPLLELGVFFLSLSFSSISRKRRRKKCRQDWFSAGGPQQEEEKGKRTQERGKGRVTHHNARKKGDLPVAKERTWRNSNFEPPQLRNVTGTDSSYLSTEIRNPNREKD